MSSGAYMAKLEKAVFDTGPFLHLHESGQLVIVEIVENKYVSREVEQELQKYAIPFNKVQNLWVKTIFPENRTIVKILSERYDLDLGEATSMALAKQEKILLFFTDDLEARDVAKTFGLEAHGTLGLLLRAFREGELNYQEALQATDALFHRSSLFITSDLLQWIKLEIKQFRG